MIPGKAPQKDVYHAPEELQKAAHVRSYEQYKELYLKSTESPDGESGLDQSPQIRCHISGPLLGQTRVCPEPI